MLHLYTDGASRGNPGLAGAGYWATLDGNVVLEGSCFLGQKTNNEAEYLALCHALEALLQRRLEKNAVTVHADSELLIRQLEGRYKVKSESLKTLHARASELLNHFSSTHLRHIPRGQNRRADELANLAIDQAPSVTKQSAPDKPGDRGGILRSIAEELDRIEAEAPSTLTSLKSGVSRIRDLLGRL